MDPNLFHLDWDRLLEAFAAVTALAIIVERSLALVFENRFYLQRFGDRNIKEFVAFVVAFILCRIWSFDAVSVVVLSDHASLIGELLTAGVIAGGSKGSIKLFQELLNWQSDAVKERKAAHEARVAAATDAATVVPGGAGK